MTVGVTQVNLIFHIQAAQLSVSHTHLFQLSVCLYVKGYWWTDSTDVAGSWDSSTLHEQSLNISVVY